MSVAGTADDVWAIRAAFAKAMPITGDKIPTEIFSHHNDNEWLQINGSDAWWIFLVAKYRQWMGEYQKDQSTIFSKASFSSSFPPFTRGRKDIITILYNITNPEQIKTDFLFPVYTGRKGSTRIFISSLFLPGRTSNPSNTILSSGTPPFRIRRNFQQLSLRAV
jgi:hypothetical protein